MNKPNMLDLEKNYKLGEHFQIPCRIVDNPRLNKMLTGEGAKVAKEMYKDYVAFDADFDKEDRYKIFKIAEKINNNPDVVFFTCVSDRAMSHIHLEIWADDVFMNAVNLLGENNGNAILNYVLEK